MHFQFRTLAIWEDMSGQDKMKNLYGKPVLKGDKLREVLWKLKFRVTHKFTQILQNPRKTREARIT